MTVLSPAGPGPWCTAPAHLHSVQSEGQSVHEPLWAHFLHQLREAPVQHWHCAKKVSTTLICSIFALAHINVSCNTRLICLNAWTVVFVFPLTVSRHSCSTICYHQLHNPPSRSLFLMCYLWFGRLYIFLTESSSVGSYNLPNIFIYLFFLQAQPSPHPVREDCIWSPRWPPQPGDRSRPHLPAPASWPRGHAGCYCSDGDAPVHQQRAAKSGCAFHHPLRSLDWGSGWRTRGFSQSKGKPFPFPHCGDFFSLKYNLKLSCRRDSLHRTWITRFTTSCPVLGQNMALASGNLALELSIRYFLLNVQTELQSDYDSCDYWAITMLFVY